jgi:hypothetical protein
LSIKFPDLQVLFPRAHDSSRAEQHSQRQVEISQAQVAAQTGEETTVRRRQVAGTEKQRGGRIDEKDARGRRQLTQQDNERERKSSDDDSNDVPQGDLGRKIDIRI